MPKPLVLHIITRLEPGGSSRNTADSCAAQTADFDVVLMAGPDPGSGPLLELLPPEVNYVEIGALQREISPFRDLAALLRLTRGIARLEPALVHTHTSKAGALGRLAARLAGLVMKKRPVVIHTPHGHLLYGYYGPLKTAVFLWIERLLARLTDYFVALTPGELEESAGAGIGRRGQWRVIHSGVELSPPAAKGRREDLGIAPGEVAVGTIARLEKVKGTEYLVRAADILARRRPDLKLKFVLIGGGGLEPELRALANAMGLGGAVTFTGFRPDAAALASALDIYVQPSLNEAMGRAPLEAQAQGIPVIVSRVCGLPDVIREGETGFSVPPADPGALATAIERLAGDRAMRERMGAAARSWALSENPGGLRRFGTQSMTARLADLYNSVLRQG